MENMAPAGRLRKGLRDEEVREQYVQHFTIYGPFTGSTTDHYNLCCINSNRDMDTSRTDNTSARFRKMLNVHC